MGPPGEVYTTALAPEDDTMTSTNIQVNIDAAMKPDPDYHHHIAPPALESTVSTLTNMSFLDQLDASKDLFQHFPSFSRQSSAATMVSLQQYKSEATHSSPVDDLQDESIMAAPSPPPPLQYRISSVAGTQLMSLPIMTPFSGVLVNNADQTNYSLTPPGSCATAIHPNIFSTEASHSSVPQHINRPVILHAPRTVTSSDSMVGSKLIHQQTTTPAGIISAGSKDLVVMDKVLSQVVNTSEATNKEVPVASGLDEPQQQLPRINLRRRQRSESIQGGRSCFSRRLQLTAAPIQEH